jgi:hypothetical protein
MTPTTAGTFTARERDALATGQAFIYAGRVIPIIRGGDETEEEKAAREAAEADAAKPKTFTQAELDRIVQERVARVKSDPPADYEALKASAKELAELKAAGQTELEKANDRVAAAESATAAEKASAAAALATANERLIQAAVLAQATAQKAITPEHMHKLISTDAVTVGDDGQVTGVEEAVKAFLEANPAHVGNTQGGSSGSADQGARENGGATQLTKAALDTMSPGEIDKAMAEGRLTNVLAGGS